MTKSSAMPLAHAASRNQDVVRRPVSAFPLPDSALSQRVASHMEAIEQALLEAVEFADPLAADASRYLIDAGGKRLRPFLVLLASELGSGVNDQVINAAVTVELTHLASLYHDDVQDSAPLRRGHPTAHHVWGNTVAIMVGDLLFARASQRVAQLGSEAVSLQARTFERLCLGQLAELTGPAAGVDAVDHYLSVLSDKTASLVAASARLGAMYAGVAPEALDALSAYGEHIGVAFQLADDVLDLTSQAGDSGKTPGTDLREHVPTMPVLLLRQRVREQGRAEDSDLLALLDGDLTDDALLGEVVDRLSRDVVVAQTRQLAARWAQSAVDCLSVIADGPVKEALAMFATALVERSQ